MERLGGSRGWEPLPGGEEGVVVCGPLDGEKGWTQGGRATTLDRGEGRTQGPTLWTYTLDGDEGQIQRLETRPTQRGVDAGSRVSNLETPRNSHAQICYLSDQPKPPLQLWAARSTITCTHPSARQRRRCRNQLTWVMYPDNSST